MSDDALDWTASDEGTWRLLTYWQHGTGQTASPSASVNSTVNYLDPDGAQAVIDYWDAVVLTPDLRAQIAQNPRAQMYMDSLELFTTGAGGLLWGRTVADEFRSRRGYAITPWLPFLTRDVVMMAVSTTYHHEPTDAQRTTVEKVRFDHVRTPGAARISRTSSRVDRVQHAEGAACRSRAGPGRPRGRRSRARPRPLGR